MILYIEQTEIGTKIYHKHHTFIVTKTPLSIIKEMCISNIFTYEGYLKACKTLFQVSQLVPVYISDDIMMMPTGRVRNYETIWVNLAAIIDAEALHDKTVLTCINDHKIVIDMSFHKYQRANHVLKQIRNTKVKHFHF